MRIVYISNGLNRHTLKLCEAFINHKDVHQFTYIATEPLAEERVQQNWKDLNKEYSFVYTCYENKERYEKAIEMTKEADVAIVSHAPYEFIWVRMLQNQITFRCTERYYKLGLWRGHVPFISYKKQYDRFLKYKNHQLYYLTIGTYLPAELKALRFPLSKCFEWAYFPQIQKVSIEELIEKRSKNGVIKLIWVGRLQKEKRVQDAIYLFAYLKKNNIQFKANILGEGSERIRAERLIEKYELNDCVELLGNCSQEQTQSEMKDSEILLFTSDYWEGWGAVVSEAMSYGCIPVASDKAGATDILIHDGGNGCTYHKLSMARKALLELCNDRQKRIMMSEMAYKTMEQVWNPENAVGNFIDAVKKIERGEEFILESGQPMGQVRIKKPHNYFSTNF